MLDPTHIAKPTGQRFAVVAALLSMACSPGGQPPGEVLVERNEPEANGEPSPMEPEMPPPRSMTADGAGDPLFSDDDLETEDECDGILPVIVRDFSHLHPDFEMEFPGDEPRLNLIEPELGPERRPVFLDGVGCPRDNQRHRECNPGFFPTEPVITSASSFDEWYQTIEGVNVEFEREIELLETFPGSGVYVFQSNAFFPLSPTEGFGETPPGQGRNFLFTTEIRTQFTYVPGQVFTFVGDDDLWIFVNGRLALDLGGMHGEREASIDFDAQAVELSIEVGSDYPMDVFHAERHTSASNFRMETNIACFTPGRLR